MKEKINRLAEGIFEYRESEVVTIPEELTMEMDAGKNCQGAFTISNTRRQLMRGVVSTDCPYITIEENTFRGVDNEMIIHFQGDRFRPGEVFKGQLQIISDCGTKQVPFAVSVKMPSCDVSSGKIKDLFHFTNLARENTEEAVVLFSNPHFEEVFLYKDTANIALYRGLLQGSSQGLAMEEFLIAIRKKLPIQLSVSQVFLQYDNCTESFVDHIELRKDTWGFGEFHISSDAEFVEPEHKMIWTDRFAGDRYSLGFLVDPKKMTPGKNFARLEITTARQRIAVTITAVKPGIEHDKAQHNRRKQRTIYQIIKRHLDFCMDRLPMQDYIHELDRLLQSSSAEADSMQLQLYRSHIGILDHRAEQVERLLNDLEEQAEVLHRDAPDRYAAFYYLKGLWANDDSVRADCVSRIRECYEKQGQIWQVLWFLLYLDPELQTDRRKMAAIMDQLKRGCYSPVLYLEVCNILNETPDYLTELTPELAEVLHWGCKHQYLKQELALRYVYLAGRLKIYSPRIVEDLTRLYQQYEDDEILTAICKTLMKGQITSSKGFYWYSKGVAHNLKITDLYEYYMYSLDETQEISLNRSILLYFLYDNHLTMDKKAMLYAYIVRGKAKDPETYQSYREIMQDFTFHQLREGRVSENLAVLYEEFINEETIDEQTSLQLADIMFTHTVICHNPEIVGVYVKHRELEKEEYVPFVKGKANVTILTEQAQIFLADALDNRYASSIDYTLNKLLRLEHLAERCLEFQGVDRRLLLYLYDRADHLNRTGSHVMEIRRRVLELSGLTELFQRKVFSGLLRYYYNNYEGDLLDTALEQMDWHQVDTADRELFIEYCAVRKCFDKAMEGILLFGFEGTNAKRLLAISEKAFREKEEERDPRMVKLAWAMFQEKVFNSDTLRYLCRYYTGTVRELVQIWKVAEEAGMETLELQERLLAQAVFSDEIIPEVFDVFYFYQEKGDNKRLLLAFKKKMAYNYLIKGRKLPQEMFGYYFRDVQIKENLPCLIAVLKYFSQCDKLSEEEVNFADYHVNKLYDQKIVFPFYRDFYGKFPLPVHIMDEHYVEYITDPEYEVMIYYRITSGESEGKYKAEKMRDVFEGIRVKEFVLFQDEVLEYYVIEHRPGEDVKSEVKQVTMNESMDSARASSRYHTLNLMMIAQEMHDDATLIDLMEEYAKEREMAKEVFRPM